MARNTRELARRPEIDPEEQPSVEWGWHSDLTWGKWIAGGFTIVTLLAMMLVGHDEGRTIDLWMIGFILFIAAGLALEAARRRRPWRR